MNSDPTIEIVHEMSPVTQSGSDTVDISLCNWKLLRIKRCRVFMGGIGILLTSIGATYAALRST